MSTPAAAAALAASSPAAMQSHELMRRFTAFLDRDNGRGALSARVSALANAFDPAQRSSSARRLIVSVDDLRAFDPDLCATLLTTPVDTLPVLEHAVQDLAAGAAGGALARDRRALAEFRVGLDGALGARGTLTPRALKAGLVGGVVAVDGIVTRASAVRPRLVVSVHYCPATGQFLDRTYKDASSVSSLAAFTQNAGMPGSAIPTRDEDGNPLETEYGRCWYRDFQRITLQEMPEASPAGQLPRSVEIFLEGDLCDSCKPGDRVRIIGIYRPLGGEQFAGGTGIFKTVVVANNILTLSGNAGGGAAATSASLSAIPMHDDDIRNIRKLASKGDVFERLSKSIAPSIYGHEFIKKALLLLLIGGKEHNLENGTHLRGDINVMMVGDPSTAKSQLLRFMLHIAPLAISTTGRGSSGVGLTAAVTSDPDTNDRHLEAGAMVLADRGIVCIDEFDKMSDEDRVAIHEVMEQQTVTIAKAGILASLNARCSVVAAANPVYGSYDKTRKPHENIALPDSLLSRFDLLFIVLDSSDPDRDRLIADHVLRGHRFRKSSNTLDEADDSADLGGPAPGRGLSLRSRSGAHEMSGIGDGIEGADNGGGSAGPVPMYESATTSLYSASPAPTNGSGVRRSGRRSSQRADPDKHKIISTEFIKRYIHYAKTRASPSLTEAAAEAIGRAYSSLRQDVDSNKTLPITARCLETMIRLATAHAKCRLDKVKVTEEDAEVAIKILKYALFNQAEPDMSEKLFMRRHRAELKRAAAGKAGKADSKADTDTEDEDDEVEDGEEHHASSAEPKDGVEDIEKAHSDIAPNTSPTLDAAAESEEDPKADATNLRTTQASGDSGGDEAAAEDRVRRVMKALNEKRGRRGDGSVQLEAVLTYLGEEEEADDDAEPLTVAQVREALATMASRDQVVLSDDMIFIV
jgi:DNA replication licensing factor MCM3